MELPNKVEIETAAKTVYAAMPPTPQYAWPLLAERTGASVWVKHENHSPIGAFKVRGGLVYMSGLRASQPNCTGVIAATRGNHGQSIAFAARANCLNAVIVVPGGNSQEKNAAMQALGAELIVHGHDFQEAYEYSYELADERGLTLVPSFAEDLVSGVSTYALEMLNAAPDLDTLYVSIGLGSGICSCIAAREALGLTTKIVGVVAENAPCYALSFDQGKPVSTNSADTLADGLACRVPDAEAVAVINRYAERIVTVDEAEIKAAMRHYFTDTHNVAEGAGAAPLAALLQEREQARGQTVGLVLSGGNVDRDLFQNILAEVD
ncbi:MAG: threonine dehydratase [Alphaproteobacteria bacterium]|nr:threonine dehydratase [Alphaproteobacteria bacterium]